MPKSEKKIKGRNGGTLSPWQPGQSGNPAGKPRKYVSKLTDSGYNLNEINQTIQNLLAMTTEELSSVDINPDATVLEKIIAKSLVGSSITGGIKPIEKLIDRAFGKAIQSVSVTTPANIKLEIKSDDAILAMKEYQELVKSA